MDSLNGNKWPFYPCVCWKSSIWKQNRFHQIIRWNWTPIWWNNHRFENPIHPSVEKNLDFRKMLKQSRSTKSILSTKQSISVQSMSPIDLCSIDFRTQNNRFMFNRFHLLISVQSISEHKIIDFTIDFWNWTIDSAQSILEQKTIVYVESISPIDFCSIDFTHRFLFNRFHPSNSTSVQSISHKTIEARRENRWKQE